MLSNEDKQWIANLIKKQPGNNPQKGSKPVDNPIKTLSKNTIDTLNNAANSAYNSRIGRSAVESLMYTNPITALLYQNKDIFKTGKNALKGIGMGVGKGLWNTGSYLYNLSKQQKEKHEKLKLEKEVNKYSSSNLLASKNKLNKLPVKTLNTITARQNTNYIVARNAVFLGGRNNIVVSDNYGGFAFNKGQEKVGTTPIKAIGQSVARGIIDKKDKSIIQMTKGIDGIYKATKQSTKLLGLLKAKQMLIFGGILLGVAAIAGLVLLIRHGIQKLNAFFNKNMEKAFPKATPKVTPKLQQQSFKDQSLKPMETLVDNIQKGVTEEQSVPTELKEFNKVYPVHGKEQGWKKMAKGIYNSAEFRSGYETQSKEGSVYRAPFNMKVLYWKENSKKLGIVNIIAEKIVPRGINRNIEIMNVAEPCVVENQFVKKGQPIGLVGPTGKIMIKDITSKDMEDYLKMINEYASNPNKDEFKMTESQNKQITKNFEKLEQQKKLNPNKEATTYNPTATDPRYDYNNEIQKNSQILQDAINTNKLGTNITIGGVDTYIPKEKMQSMLDTYSKYGYESKNMELTKNAIQEGNKKQQKEHQDKISSTETKTPKINLEADSGDKLVMFSLTPIDVVNASSEPIGLTRLG